MRFILLLALALPASARELYWDSVKVNARLEEDGRLRIREEQTYVFNGDWNGGERTFRVGRGQRLELQNISRRDASGQLVPLNAGSLDSVDDYDMTGNRLRWRSRLPSDAPFVNERITYVIEYAIANVLEKDGDYYTLDHDFAFPDRSGQIKRFTLDIDLDPSWRAIDLDQHLELTNMPPGNSAVVSGKLEYTGSSAPEAQATYMPLRLGFTGLILVAPVLLWGRLRYREERLGRFEPLQTHLINPRWIEENVLPMPAEIAGATWDEDVGANEVSALLARWAAEGKITANASADELVMKLNVPRERFEGHERELIDKLFFAGNDTSTSAIRAHYKQSGFSPSTIISRPIFDRVNALAPMKDPAPKINILPSLLLFLVTAASLVTAVKRTEDVRLVIAGVVMFFTWIAGLGLAHVWKGRIDYGTRQAKGFLICIGIATTAAAIFLLLVTTLPLAYIAVTTFALLVANNVLNVAKSKKGPAAIAYRKRLAAVRQYFIDELGKTNPAIDDRWFPYVIAFGLNDEAGRWMKDFGGQSRTTGYVPGTSSSTSVTRSSGPTWTGGGGAFGGAGASGSWASAAAGVAAGVASASSSSGSGGGGGGGRSGGGGGGGW